MTFLLSDLDIRCHVQTFSPTNGRLKCEAQHGDPVKTGTICNIQCDDGFIRDVGSTSYSATCKNATWEQTGSCGECRQILIVSFYCFAALVL